MDEWITDDEEDDVDFDMFDSSTPPPKIARIDTVILPSELALSLPSPASAKRKTRSSRKKTAPKSKTPRKRTTNKKHTPKKTPSPKKNSPRKPSHKKSTKKNSPKKTTAKKTKTPSPKRTSLKKSSLRKTPTRTPPKTSPPRRRSRTSPAAKTPPKTSSPRKRTSPKKSTTLKKVRKATPRPKPAGRRRPRPITSVTPRRSARKAKRPSTITSIQEGFEEEDEEEDTRIKFDLDKHVDKVHRGLKYKELVKLDVDAILGVGPVFSDHLNGLGIFTVEELGTFKPFVASYELYKARNKGKMPVTLMSAFKSKWRETAPAVLLKEPLSAITGVSPRLELCFNGMEMWLVNDLSLWKNFQLAQHIVNNKNK